MKLEDYRKNNELTYQQLAVRLELKRSKVYNICKGVGDITLKTANKILVKTSGTVNYEDLLSPKQKAKCCEKGAELC